MDYLRNPRRRRTLLDILCHGIPPHSVRPTVGRQCRTIDTKLPLRSGIGRPLASTSVFNRRLPHGCFVGYPRREGEGILRRPTIANGVAFCHHDAPIRCETHLVGGTGFLLLLLRGSMQVYDNSLGVF